MGIASDWARIKGNINAALAAIAEKGVTVPDGSNSDALAGLIASIQAGGASGLAKVATGTVTISYPKLSELEIAHGLGVAPDFAMLYAETSVFDKSGIMGAIIFKLSDGHDLYINAGKYSGNTRGVYFSSMSNWTDTNLDDTKVTFTSELIMSGSSSSKTVNFDTNSTYRWIAGVYA